MIMMKISLTVFCILSIAVFASCDMRSETAKKEMEKFSGSPTPPISPTPVETPIDPADIVQVDVNIDGDLISINGDDLKKDAACKKFDRISVNGNTNAITITGPCRQITVNGDSNQITADAAMEFVFNGTGNTAMYSRFPNGKRPIVTENQAGNTVEKVVANTTAKPKGLSKTTK
ncbi:MAG: DUF3060 domain-containing protein [Acidobacteriota bacterium]